MLIEELHNGSSGYHPFLITENWQVAQLNYSEEQNAQNIQELEIHFHTDETFTLLQGSAFLIAVEDGSENMEMKWLKKGWTYNVPAGIWHNIAMQEGSSVLITENALTHKEPKKLHSLSESGQRRIREFQKQEDL